MLSRAIIPHIGYGAFTGLKIGSDLTFMLGISGESNLSWCVETACIEIRKLPVLYIEPAGNIALIVIIHSVS